MQEPSDPLNTQSSSGEEAQTDEPVVSRQETRVSFEMAEPKMTRPTMLLPSPSKRSRAIYRMKLHLCQNPPMNQRPTLHKMKPR